MKRFVFTFLCSISFEINCFAQNQTLIDFSGVSAEANDVTLLGAGFGEYPMPDITFGDIPTDNAFDGATDGRGMVIAADPYEGVMIQTTPISTSNCALLRCAVRLSAPHASLYLASIDQGQSSYVSTITPSNPASFVNQYQRIADFFLPPSTGFQGIIQVINTSDTEILTAYIDNFEIIEMKHDNINVSIENISSPQLPTPTNTPTATPTPQPTSTPTPYQSSFTGKTTIIPLNLPEGATELIMVKIPDGSFTMGSPIDERGRSNDEFLPHKVTFAKGFYIGRYEITQAQYQAVMNKNPSHFENQPNNPVEKITLSNAAEFCNKLSEQEGLKAVYTGIKSISDLSADGYRLPTEAEWEYACRAGTSTRFSFGDVLEMADSDEIYNEIADQYMWWEGNNTYNGNAPGTKEVGLKKPNPWSLYDMHGNVNELCNEGWDYYDYEGSKQGFYAGNVFRGGRCDGDASQCRSAFRGGQYLPFVGYNCGFRICRTSYDFAPSATPMSNPSQYTGETHTIPLDSPEGVVELVMVKIPAGTFEMGNNSGDPDEKPVHHVTISKDFYIGIHEITQAQWQAVMGNNPSYMKWDSLPMENVSWNDCQEFITKLNQMDHGTFRLPTEAEWEYACRAGTTTDFYWGNENIDNYAWYFDNSSSYTQDSGSNSQEVAMKLPNNFGVFDMSGNIYEWCNDWYGDYTSKSVVDPMGNQSGSYRVMRGGSWETTAWYCRSSDRTSYFPKYSGRGLGFRIMTFRTQ